MDSITITINQSPCNSHGLLFTIVQNSIRFERMKRLAVYDDKRFLGIHSIVAKDVFHLGELPRMISMLVFGCHESEGVKMLRKFKVKGKISDNTEMALIALAFQKLDPKHELPTKQIYRNETEKE